jgi:hypothetical protein
MKRTLATIAGAAVLVAASFGNPASAAAEAVAGCGNGQTLTDLEGVIEAVDWSIYTPEQQTEIEALIASVDSNGDGYFCIMQKKPNKGQDRQWGAEDYVVTKIGDNKAAGQTG